MDKKTTPSPAPEAPDPRRQKVREKLREMYGDDTADTVRHFLNDLILNDLIRTDLFPEGESGPPN